MASPTVHADETLKALSRYLAGHPRVLWRYPRQEWTLELDSLSGDSQEYFGDLPHAGKTCYLRSQLDADDFKLVERRSGVLRSCAVCLSNAGAKESHVGFVTGGQSRAVLFFPSGPRPLNALQAASVHPTAFIRTVRHRVQLWRDPNLSRNTFFLGHTSPGPTDEHPEASIRLFYRLLFWANTLLLPLSSCDQTSQLLFAFYRIMIQGPPWVVPGAQWFFVRHEGECTPRHELVMPKRNS